MPRLTFHGAAETVTGSKYLLESGSDSVLIDCGLFQGRKDLRERNWEKLPFPPKTVNAVVLTHAHIDHIGYVPKFVKDAFNGPIYCTPSTQEIAELQLLDSARIQEEDADYANRKGFSKHKPALPLYSEHDVRRAMRKFRTVQRDEWFQAAGPIWMRFHDAGHLLGSSMIECEVRETGKTTRLLFSGDVGRFDAPLYFDPKTPPECDYLVCESTYGNRDHAPGKAIDSLEKAVLDAIERGGVMLMAAFAVGRAQQLIYLLSVLMRENRIPEIPVFLDSPMAVSGMKIYQYYSVEHDLSESLNCQNGSAFDLKNVYLAKTRDESKHINSTRSNAVIISSSGMMTGGRILHHLRQRLPDPKNTIVLGGFQAEGTRGRALQEGARTMRIHGQDIPVRAAVVEMTELSGHADRGELLRWLAPLPAPKQVFITHGEVASANAFAELLQTERGWNCLVPKMGQSVELT
jgi:metallo-beta-lactamase family protein